MEFLQRILIIFMISQIVSACQNLKKMLPEGPALSNKERESYLSKPPHQISYNDVAKVDFPILPLQVWAATYELDIILVSTNPDWNMHEYALLKTPKGDLWVMKDAEEGTLNQFIITDLPDVQDWLPELPVTRKSYPVKIVDKSTEKNLDMSFYYENMKGQKVEASYQGKRPTTALKKKNGSTMGHSRQQLLVALDLPYRDFGKKASISYDGKFYKMDKLLGLVPFQMALTQTQGGASSGQFTMQSENGQLTTTHQTQSQPCTQNWTIEQKNGQTIVQQKNDFRSLVYEFSGTEKLELKKAYVQQWNKKEKGVSIEFSPALPDLRFPFEGEFTSNFVMDIAGKNGNAIGTVTALWKDGQAQLLVNPTKPWWVTDRPMKTVINYQNGKAEISIQMGE